MSVIFLFFILNFELPSVTVIHTAAKFRSLFDVNSINLLCYWQTTASF